MIGIFTGTLLKDDGNYLEGVDVVVKSINLSEKTKTNKNGIFNILLKNINLDSDITITFSKNGYNLYQIKNPQSNKIENEEVFYYIPRITLFKSLNIVNTITSQVNQNLNTQESDAATKMLSSDLSFETKLLNTFNSKKEEIQSKLIPFIISQLIIFGPNVVQLIVNDKNILKYGSNPSELINEINDYVSCPDQKSLLLAINKRNKVAKQINNLYKIVKIINKTSDVTNGILGAVQIGLTTIKTLPYPATGVPPLGLPPLTSGIIEITGASADLLQNQLISGKITLSSLNITAASFGSLLGSALNLLNILDILIQKCAQDQAVSFVTINNEINLLNNQSQNIKQTQDNLIYKGFKLELKLDEQNKIQYPKRYAQALNRQGVPVLKTESSFASDPQILIDQLKFIIDSNPNLTSE